MKAAYIQKHGDLQALHYGDLTEPKAGPGEVKVRVYFSGLNHLDLWVREGIPGLKVAFPHILGGDASGVIEEVGEGVEGLFVNEKVIVHPGLACMKCNHCVGGEESLCKQYKILGEHVSGTNADKVVVPCENIFRKPDSISFEVAAAMPLVFTTAWHMLVRRAMIKKGQTVLIHGAGSGVSMAGIQIAKLFTDEIAVTSGNAEKLKAAEKLGAKYLIHSETEDFLKKTRGIWIDGCDIIFDHVGKDFWERNIRLVKNGGKLVTCGATSGFDALTDLRHVFYRQIQICGSTMGNKSDFPEILKHFASGKFTALVDSIFPLNEIGKAHERMGNREQMGKILLRVAVPV